MSEICCKKISNHDAWNTQWRTCGRPAKVEVDGKHYCGMHDPIKRDRREVERQKKLEAERKESGRIRKLHDASQDLLDALQATGALPDGYCWCGQGNDCTTGECVQGRAAIKKAGKA